MSANTLSPRKRRKAATRRQLLDAARARFIAAGVANTNVADVSRAAGVAHGTFYVHFANKNAVVRELLGELNAELARRVTPIVSRATTLPLDVVVRRVATAFLDHWSQQRELIACLAEHMVAGLSMVELRDGINPPAVAMLEAGLRELATKRAASDGEVGMLTHALLAMWLRIGLRYLFADDAPRRSTLALLVRLTIAAIDAALPPQEVSDAPLS